MGHIIYTVVICSLVGHFEHTTSSHRALVFCLGVGTGSFHNKQISQVLLIDSSVRPAVDYLGGFTARHKRKQLPLMLLRFSISGERGERMRSRRRRWTDELTIEWNLFGAKSRTSTNYIHCPNTHFGSPARAANSQEFQ